jgi:hypothetical protein
MRPALTALAAALLAASCAPLRVFAFDANTNAQKTLNMAAPAQKEFQLREGAHIFSPKDLIELPRPGAGLANDAGDLVLVPVSKYSFEDKKCVYSDSPIV